MDQHSLLDDDGATPTQETPSVNVFDDAFEADDLDLVADGFRPGYNHDREGSGRQDHTTSLSTHSLEEHYAPLSPQTHNGPSRSSTRKSRSHENPFVSPEDGEEADPPLRRTASGNFAPPAQRTVSSTSSNQYARTHSQRFGAGGPSHPYGMYPQGTVARTASVATASTVQPQPQSTSRDGPQHPYALYPQGVADDSDDEQDEARNPVPVGFLGLGQSFQRRRGPDGEEQDILGYFGHTEQLPPYTRYPEDGPEKAPLLGIPEPPTALHSRAPVLGTDPGMSLMHAQLNPAPTPTPPAAPQSMTDETQLQRQESRMSRASASLLGSGASSDDSGATKKSWSEKSWKDKRKHKFCGVPFWVYLLALGTLSFIAIVLGAVIGGFVEGQKKAEQKASASSTAPLYDVSFIATPTATSPPTNTFSLSLGPAQEVQSECLTNPSQRAAWDCILADHDGVGIQVNTVEGSNTAGASLFYQGSGSVNRPLYYGTQASYMSTSWEPFLLVMDNDDPQDGPAFYFQAYYDKVVVIPELAMEPPPPNEQNPNRVKRQVKQLSPEWFEANPVAVPGTKPWFCFWNTTFVEGFIYPKQRAVQPPPVTRTGTIPLQSLEPYTSLPNWMSAVTASPAATITTVITMPTTKATYTGAASALPSWLHAHYPNFNINSYKPPTASDNADSLRSRKRNNAPYPYSERLPLYPDLVKIEERRLPQSPAPYCVQYQVLNNLVVNWVGDAQGQPIVVHLAEQDPSYAAYESAGLAEAEVENQKRSLKRRLLEKRKLVPGSCHCEWWSGK